LFNELTEENLFLFAAKHYYNPVMGDIDEFYEDMNRFKYIKRLVNKYLETGNLSERLIINHLITVYNVFGIEPANRIVELKLDSTHWPVIKPFLIFLRYIDNQKYIDIPMDPKVVEKLRTI
tara:strand:- start:243 stop:605 length:363 start_codon:yes stop_codon:yes gene_type:complete